MIQRTIPSTGEKLAAIGLGTWQTFDVPVVKPELTQVLETMHSKGGRLIDSSPMYGKSEAMIGRLTGDMKAKDDFFYATKVWTTGLQAGIAQMQSSMQKMGRAQMDLIQIHNLVDWQTHLPQLRKWKEEGIIRYIGITHYTDASHDSLIEVLKKEPVDFVQLNYSINARHAETKILAFAAEKGVATIINRLFGEGALFQKVKGKPLPPWAAELDIKSWPQYFLKYILSHPAVTCVIPATADPAHARDNFEAGEGRLPGEDERKKMVEYLKDM